MGTSKKILNSIRKEAKQNTKNVSNFNDFMMVLGDVKPEDQETSTTTDDSTTTNVNGKREIDQEDEEKEEEEQQVNDKKPPKRIKKSKEERFMEKQQKIRDDIQKEEEDQKKSTTTTLSSTSSTTSAEVDKLKKELEMVKEELENREAELKMQEKFLRKSKKETKDLQREIKSTIYKVNPKATRSIAIPNDILDDFASEEMKTYLVEMIARTLVLFSIDEVIVYRSTKSTNSTTDKLCKLLEFIDLPKNIRHHLYDLNDIDYQFVDKLKRVESGQHATSNRWTKYREGIVLDKLSGKFSLVDVGLGDGKEIKIDKELQAGIRVTLEMEEEHGKQINNANQHRKGKVVSPAEVRHDGHYWGYQVRSVDSIDNVFQDSSFNAYDYKILFTCNSHDNQEVQDLKQQRLKEKQDIFDNNLESQQHVLIIFAEREQQILDLLKQLPIEKEDEKEEDENEDKEEEKKEDGEKKEKKLDKSLDKIIDLQSDNTLKSKRVRFEETLLIGLSSLLNKVI
ncbi:DUF171 family protein [Cavenderia fasciculata]|uniref:DUF171 family protein n=1 Tax=Cavenderia fasciculata TaxID=261658 RepID=F4PXI5_CACFS|nr:DUF171 family protein [Cavenderia fasciculata]EGG19495.1 DUF171 family protein [Cavenderia fasciculata]|eukprot:XP_004357789.1 DUF171 family protein [Cavenderia fasciculata]